MKLLRIFSLLAVVNAARIGQDPEPAEAPVDDAVDDTVNDMDPAEKRYVTGSLLCSGVSLVLFHLYSPRPQHLSFRVITTLMQFCPFEVGELHECYNAADNAADLALRDCTDCAWKGLANEDDPECSPEELFQTAETDYAACSDVCDSNCDSQVMAIYGCATTLFCNSGEPSLTME